MSSRWNDPKLLVKDVAAKWKAIGRWLRGRWNDVKLFFKELQPAVVFAAILGVVAFLVSRPATSIEAPWPFFQVLQRYVLWVVRSTAFRSVVAPLALLVGYGLLYYEFRIRGRRFIVVSDFRVWGNLEKKNPAKGVAGRLQDELMRLLDEMRASESGVPTEKARADAPAEAGPSQPKPVLAGGFVPETQVTLQYEGISLEGLHTFFRRVTGRELVITGDLLGHPNGFLIVARTKDHGPWEVLIGSLDAISLGKGLQRLAIRILTTLSQGFFPIKANNFVFLQFKAEEVEEYDLLVHLADLASNAASVSDETTAQENFAAAYHRRGSWHLDNNRPDPAKRDFTEAIEWSPSDFLEAWVKLGEANEKLGLTVEAEEAVRQASDIREKKRESDQRSGPSNGGGSGAGA